MSNEEERAPILIVDDEPEILHSLKGLLRREFRLHTAQSGQEALEVLRREPIHVIMTDQRMPEMTGAELLGKASKVSPHSVRIIFTGYADIKAVVDAVNQGSLYRYLVKPWDPDELVNTLHAAAAEYAHRERQRHLFQEIGGYLERALELSDCDSSTFPDVLRQRGRQLLDAVQAELETYHHAASRDAASSGTTS